MKTCLEAAKLSGDERIHRKNKKFDESLERIATLHLVSPRTPANPVCKSHK